MNKISPEDRERVKKLLTELESTDLTKVHEGEVSHRINTLQGIFDRLGVELLRDYHKRLEKFIGTSREYFRFFGSDGLAKPDKPDKPDNPKKMVYVGMSGITKLRVKCFLDHIFLERIYQGSVKMSWRLNPGGRLDLVDAMLFPLNEVRNIIVFEDYMGPPYVWESRRAEYMPLFPEVNLIDPRFDFMKSDERYQIMMNSGHSMARELIANLDSGNIRDSFTIKDGQKQLSEIVNDDPVMDILENAGEISPAIISKNNGYLTVKYVPFIG